MKQALGDLQPPIVGSHQGPQPLVQPENNATQNPPFQGHQQQKQQSVKNQMLANSHGNGQNANTKQYTPSPPDPRHLLEKNPSMSQEELLAPHTSSNMFDPYQVHHIMRFGADNLRRVQSRGPNSGSQRKEGQANPPGLRKHYLTIPAGLQGNVAVANIVQWRTETECC